MATKRKKEARAVAEALHPKRELILAMFLAASAALLPQFSDTTGLGMIAKWCAIAVACYIGIKTALNWNKYKKAAAQAKARGRR